jgi:proteasome assembly chaperone (PAC2) family protein
MRTPDDLYRLEADALPEGPVAVLVHTLQGMMDAGHAGALVADHLLGSLRSERLVTFDVDQLIDYRSRRPVMTFESTGWVNYDSPELVVDLVRDVTGTPFLVLHGAEPDLQWERFTAAVAELVERFGVRTTIGVHGIPMGVPHTRPMTVTAHGTRPDLVAGHPAIFGTIQVPGSAGALLEFRLGERGHDAIGFAANVPHYLTQVQYPQAAAELIRQIARRSGLTIPVGELEAAGREVTEAVDRQVAESAEIGAVVHALEQQFDAFVGSAGRSNLLAERSALPTADEIGAEFEAFLAEQARREGSGDGGTESDT